MPVKVVHRCILSLEAPPGHPLAGWSAEATHYQHHLHTASQHTLCSSRDARRPQPSKQGHEGFATL